MKIAVKNVDPWTVLELDGALDAEAGPGVYLQFQRVLSRGQTHFLFDLDRVNLVDSAGLGVLVRCYRDVRARGGMVGLLKVPDSIGRILEFTRLNTILQVSDEIPAAGSTDEQRAA
jgi:anti-sigma B factor antagonist